MKQYTLADLQPRDPMQNVIDDILAGWEKEKPFHKRMEDLHGENVELLSQIGEVEAEMQSKRTLLEVWKFRSQVATLRSKVDKNNDEIKNILRRLLGGR